MGCHGKFDASEVAPDTSEAKGPIDVYRTVRRVRIATGTAAGVLLGAYIAAGLMALDNNIELHQRVSNLAISAIVTCTIVSCGGWLVEAANRESARRDVAPAVAAVLDEHVDRIAGAVATRLVGCIEEVVTAGGERSHARTVTAFREIVTSELIQEELGTAVGKAFRYGMVAEAAGRASNVDNVASIRRN